MTCHLIYIWKLSSVSFILFLALFLGGCSRIQQDFVLDIYIRSPQDGTFLMQGESVYISVDIQAPGIYDHMELFMDQVLLKRTTLETFDTLLIVPDDERDSHQLLVKAHGKNLSSKEHISTYQLVEKTEEANDLESFQDDTPDGWFLSNWHVREKEGNYSDKSLVSNGEHAVAMTRKILSEPGSTEHSPGEYFGGGIVFYVDSGLQHGLIAAYEDGTYDGQREIPWGCKDLQLTSGNRASSNSNGAQNTLAIVSDCNWEQTAARYCYDLVVEKGCYIYTDWYLPALDELNMMYKNRETIGNLEGEYYWSSTTQSTYGARVINFFNGSHHGANRNIPRVAGPVAVGIYVRPIRKF